MTASQVQFEKAKRKASAKLLTVSQISTLVFMVAGGGNNRREVVTEHIGGA